MGGGRSSAVVRAAGGHGVPAEASLAAHGRRPAFARKPGGTGLLRLKFKTFCSVSSRDGFRVHICYVRTPGPVRGDTSTRDVAT